jgi:hypothetical protein
MAGFHFSNGLDGIRLGGTNLRGELLEYGPDAGDDLNGFKNSAAFRIECKSYFWLCK